MRAVLVVARCFLQNRKVSRIMGKIVLRSVSAIPIGCSGRITTVILQLLKISTEFLLPFIS